MKLREFITLLGGAAAWPLAVRAHPSRKIFKIGFLSSYSEQPGKDLVGCFQKGLKELGWIEGRHISIEYRWAQGRAERYPVLAAELAGLGLDLIASNSTPAAQALQRAVRDIPVVFMSVSDPVASGIVKTLARPEANMTGVSNFLPATSAKLLELLKFVAPNTSGVTDPPPLKWSDLRYVFDIQEDRNGKEAIQA
jgi:putative tryptophan/tyrosine transport system substrate-binding protein